MDRSGRPRPYDVSDDQTKEAETWLDAQLDDFFQPTFRQYEEFFNALRIKRGPPYAAPTEQRASREKRAERSPRAQ